MSILKKLAGAFVEMEKDPEPVIEQISPQFQPLPLTSSADGNQVSVFTEQFRKIMADENTRNFPGNDYYEFVVMKNAMSSIPQEDIRYKAAFAGWGSGGNANKEHLLNTAKIYLGLVDKEIDDFAKAFESEFNSRVLNNQRLIEEKRRRITELTTEIGNLSKEVESLSSQNSQAMVDLTSKKNAFNIAGTNQRNEILSEIDNINKYII